MHACGGTKGDNEVGIKSDTENGIQKAGEDCKKGVCGKENWHWKAETVKEVGVKMEHTEGKMQEHVHTETDGVVQEHAHTHVREDGTAYEHIHTHVGVDGTVYEHTHTHVGADGTVYEHTHAHAGAKGHSHEHTHTHEHTKAVLNRLSRLIGHLQSIKRMVEDGRDCSEVLIQLSAVKAAINNTGKVILQDHIQHCLVDAIESGDMQEIEELNKAIDRFIK